MTYPTELLEQVRAVLLNARLDGAFFVRRVEGGIRVDLRWPSYARDITEALNRAGFAVEKIEEGAALVRQKTPA